MQSRAASDEELIQRGKQLGARAQVYLIKADIRSVQTVQINNTNSLVVDNYVSLKTLDCEKFVC